MSIIFIPHPLWVRMYMTKKCTKIKLIKLLSHLHYNSMLFTINIFKKKHKNMLTSYNALCLTQPSCPLELPESFATQLQLQPFQDFQIHLWWGMDIFLHKEGESKLFAKINGQ